MQKFLDDIASGYFWLAVVMVGLVINLASAYIKDPMDRAFGKVSKTWRVRTQRQKAKLDRLVDALSDDEYRAHIRWMSHMYATRTILLALVAVVSAATSVLVSPGLKGVPQGDRVLSVGSAFQGFLVGVSCGAAYGMLVALRADVLQTRALRMFNELRFPPGMHPMERIKAEADLVEEAHSPANP